MSNDAILDEKVLRKFCVWKRHNGLGGNIVIRGNDGHKLILNKTGAMIWQLIDDSRTCHEIIKIARNQIMVGDDVNEAEIENSIVNFIKHLRNLNLITFAGKLNVWVDDN
jgi:hypothetical protein